tara:strand:- start:116135 stop:116932 length:798 start_codon:yes stop_codon:yes gene_type:complete
MSLLVDNFLSRYPEHAARILHSTSEDVFLSFMMSNLECVEKIVSNMSPSYMARAFEQYSSDAIGTICSKISETYIATIFRNVKIEKRNHILDCLEPTKKKLVSELLKYSTKQIGYYLRSTEVVLSENLSAPDAVSVIESLSKLHSPIYVVDSNYSLKGTLNLFSLLKVRDDSHITIKTIVDKRVRSFKASIPLQNISNHPFWEDNKMIPVVGKTNSFLGIISKDSISRHVEVTKEPKETRSSLNEYIYFSELLWNGLQKFWGSLR